MSRRRGQNGSVRSENGKWIVRYWEDVPGQEKRRRPKHVVGTSIGPGKVTSSEAKRLAREFIASTGVDSVEHFKQVEATDCGTTFRQQAEAWLTHMRERKRKPTSPQTTDNWEYCLRKWINPTIGDLFLASVNNRTLKPLVQKMVDGGLGPKSIQNYLQVVKMVKASVVDDNGDPVHPTTWNHDYMDVPVVKDQRRPSLTGEQISSLITAQRGKYGVLDALLAGTGMRIGEALALEIPALVSTTMLKVRKSAYGKLIKGTKTDSGYRDLDIHPLLDRMLRDFIGNRTDGFIFGTVGTGRKRNLFSGKPDTQQNILHRGLHPALDSLGLEKCGEHAFRRFRITHLRKQWRIGFPRDLEHFWLGHKPQHVSDLYCMLKDDIEFRQEWVKKVGLGFELPAELVGSKDAQLDPMDPNSGLENVA